MRIRIWNAYASNNSGSYVIVGSFGKDVDVAAIATELQEVCRAHGRWMDEPGQNEASPLHEYARAKGVAVEPFGESEVQSDAWPDSWDGRSEDPDDPAVWAAGTQLFIHSPYTVSLPRVFGQLIYQLGGAVFSHENHAHDALVTRCSFYWPYKLEGTQERRRDFLAELCADGGPLARFCSGHHWPAWRSPAGHIPYVELAAVLDHLPEGSKALHELAEAHAANASFRIMEALDPQDPCSFFRDKIEARESGLRVEVTDLGGTKVRVRSIMAEYRQHSRDPAMPERPLVLFADGAFPPVARHAAGRLEEAGASCRLVEVTRDGP